MKRPEGVDKWTYEYPGYWSFVDEDLDKSITVGECGVQMGTADLSECHESLGSEDNPRDISVVKLYDTLGEQGLAEHFEEVVYLSIRGQYEFHRRFKST